MVPAGRAEGEPSGTEGFDYFLSKEVVGVDCEDLILTVNHAICNFYTNKGRMYL